MDFFQSSIGMTPLHLAAWAGKVEPALLLLDAGAETNLCSRNGATPLHLASEHGNYGVVSLILTASLNFFLAVFFPVVQ